MGKRNTKNLGGRPTKLTDDITAKLESIFKVGGNMREACSYAGISDDSYLRWIKADRGFADKMESAQLYANVVAKNVIVDTIVHGKNDTNARWWLERKARNEFSTRNETDVMSGGEKLESLIVIRHGDKTK